MDFFAGVVLFKHCNCCRFDFRRKDTLGLYATFSRRQFQTFAYSAYACKQIYELYHFMNRYQLLYAYKNTTKLAIWDFPLVICYGLVLCSPADKNGAKNEAGKQPPGARKSEN